MRVLVALCLLMAACAVPGSHFRGVTPVRITVDGSTFDLRVLGNLAEAIRLNQQYAPRLGPLRARAGFAMALVSGCRVTGVLGDQAVMTGVLDCQDAATPPLAVALMQDYECRDVARWLQSGAVSPYPPYACSLD